MHIRSISAGIQLGCLLAAATAIGFDAPSEWRAVGIGGGGAMFGPSINPQNPDEMYVGCDMSPRFHTRDGGKSWQTIPFLQFRSLHHVPIAFTRDPNIRWAIGPARSTDAGKTWQAWDAKAWPKNRAATMLSADYANPDRALVAAGSDLWLTSDGAKSFQKVFTESTVLHLAGVFFDGETIYACSGNSGLHVSKNGGKSFEPGDATGLPAGEFISSFAGGKAGKTVRLYCITLSEGTQKDVGTSGQTHMNFRGVYALDPEQKIWAKKIAGLPERAHPFFVKKAINDADVVYVAGGSSDGHPTVCKSTNGGETWTEVFLTAGNKNIQAAWSGDKGERGWGFGEYAEGFAVSALDNQQVIITDMGGAYLSRNGGATWTAVYSYPVEPRQPGSPIRMGASYTTSGMEVVNVWHLLWLDPQNLFACLTDIKGLRSDDGGKSWSFNYKGHDLNTMYYALQDPRTKAAYGVTSSIHDIYHTRYLTDIKLEQHAKGLLLCSTDHFATWKTIKSFNMALHSMAMDPTNANRLYIGAINHQDGGIYVTSDLDKGTQATWTKLAAPPRTEGHPLSIVPLSDGALLCSYSGRRIGNTFTPSSGVFYSPDGGKTWEDRSDPAMQLWTKEVAVDPSDAAQNTWYAGVCFDGGGTQEASTGLWRTTNRGKSWSQIANATLSGEGFLNVQSVAFVPDHPECLFFSTSGDGIFFTSNLTADKPVFKQVATFPFAKARHMVFNPYKKNEIWVCTSGNGIVVGELGK